MPPDPEHDPILVNGRKMPCMIAIRLGQREPLALMWSVSHANALDGLKWDTWHDYTTDSERIRFHLGVDEAEALALNLLNACQRARQTPDAPTTEVTPPVNAPRSNLSKFCVLCISGEHEPSVHEDYAIEEAAQAEGPGFGLRMPRDLEEAIAEVAPREPESGGT